MGNFTYGDLILLQIALTGMLQGLDIGTASGQCASSIMGKIEYQVSQLGAQATRQMPITPNESVSEKDTNN